MGIDSASHLLDILIELQPKFHSMLQKASDLQLTRDEEDAFHQATLCWLCQKPFQEQVQPDDGGTQSSRSKVRDHCHYSGKFLGAAHGDCNLKRRVEKRIPLFCHNLTNYDSHFLVKIMDKSRAKRLTIGRNTICGLPKNSESFRTLQLGSYHFIDSCAFLSASLDNLVNSLRLSQHDYPLMRQLPRFQRLEPEKFNLLLRKGVFPYEFCQDIDKFKTIFRFS
jgi:hypothetical protein